MGSHGVGHDWSNLAAAALYTPLTSWPGIQLSGHSSESAKF